MHIIKPFLWPKHLKANHHGPWNLRVLFYHSSEEPNEEFPSEWYRRAFPKLWKLSHALRNVAEVDGRLVHIDDDSTIRDENVIHKMYAFKSLARAFLGSPAMQRASNNEVVATSSAMVLPKTCFSKADERERLILNSLTKVCNYLNISAQQRKSVRLTICPQVTHQRIWIGALEEILRGLKSEMESLNNRVPPKKAAHMAEQIVTSCLCFLADTAVSSDPDSVSWIRLHPTEKANSVPSHQWGDILEMFNDLTKCLRGEMKILYHMSKVEVMKEGLFQIKDVLLDRDLGYKEARHQESLVQKKLSKSLGHSSQCLFTLLQYYLHGHVQDSEVDFCGGVYKGVVKGSSCLCIGKILTSNEEKVVWSGVKQLDRALGLFRFVWETAGMKEVLELQGHLWYVGTEKRTLTYRGNVFFLHTIRI